MSIAEVSIRAFDCHLTLDALLRPDGLRPEFAWLSDAAAYGQQLLTIAAQPPGMRLEPWSDLHRHPFWGRYHRAVRESGAHGPMLMPLRCRPSGTPVRLRSTVLDRQPTLRRTAWLWPFGWSSEVRVRARRAVPLDALQPLVGSFLSGLETITAAPASTSLSRVFKTMGEEILSAVWADGQLPLPSRKLDRFVVMTVTTAQGDEVRRFQRRPPTTRQWPDADRAKVYGVVCNKVVAPAALAGLQAQTAFVDLDAGSFALLDLQARRMLVYLTVSRRAPGQWQQCLEANLADFLRQALALETAREAFKRDAPRHDVLAELAAAADRVLTGLGDAYASPFARKLVEVRGWNRPV